MFAVVKLGYIITYIRCLTDCERGVTLATPRPFTLHSYLGAGRVDPFGTIAGFELNQYALEVLDFGIPVSPVGRIKLTHITAVHDFRPTLIPNNSGQHPIKGSWLYICRTSPMVLFTFLFGAAENHLMHCGGIDRDLEYPRWRLYFHNLAIKHVNEQITKLSENNEPPSDELLACILTLAVYGAQGKTTSLSGSSSALSKAQTLDAVSHRQHVRAHKEALIYLVAKKGGLSNIRMFGISVLIQA